MGDLINRIDSACYKAKGDGVNRIHIYRLEDRLIENCNNQMQCISRINAALQNNSFVLHLQAISGFKNNNEANGELLIRMRGENGKLYQPSSFLPIAQRYHMMPLIDRWVVNAALTIIVRKGAAFKMVCAINLSEQSLSQEEFLDFVIAKIKQHKVNPNRLCFEITEIAAVTNLTKARQFIQTLRAIRCRFA